MKQMKYGWIGGGKVSVQIEMGASEVIKAASGRFITLDANGRGEIAGDGDAAIFGFVEAPEETTSTTEGGTKYNCIIDPTAKFRIPVDSGTYVASMRGESCDLAVSSDIQGVQLDATAEDTIILIDGDVDDNDYVDVMMNPNKMGATGVTD